jgi:hypothetical protein
VRVAPFLVADRGLVCKQIFFFSSSLAICNRNLQSARLCCLQLRGQGKRDRQARKQSAKEPGKRSLFSSTKEEACYRHTPFTTVCFPASSCSVQTTLYPANGEAERGAGSAERGQCTTMTSSEQRRRRRNSGYRRVGPILYGEYIAEGEFDAFGHQSFLISCWIRGSSKQAFLKAYCPARDLCLLLQTDR